MGTPIATVNDVPVYAAEADLDTTQQEHGNLSVTVVPPSLWIWLDGQGWTAVTSTVSTALTQRVTRLEQRLACLADCLTFDGEPS